MSGRIDKLEGLVIVTGASSGLGFELARRAARDGTDMVLVAEADLSDVELAVREAGAGRVETVLCDLADARGLARLLEAVDDRVVSALFVNAAEGRGGPLLDQEWDRALHMINTNVTGTVRLVQVIGRRMRDRGRGRILMSGAIAVAQVPAPSDALQKSAGDFIRAFALALRDELKGTGVVVSLLPPAMADARSIELAGQEDTSATPQEGTDPALLAERGYAALLADDHRTVNRISDRAQSELAGILPDELLAQLHLYFAGPANRVAPHETVKAARP